MADAKLTALTLESSPALTDVVYFVDDPGGTPLSRKTTIGNLLSTPSPTFVTPALGTPSSGNLANCTAYPGDSSLTTVGTVTTGTWSATAIEGTAIASTGEVGGTKYLREDGDGTCSWQAVAGGAFTATDTKIAPSSTVNLDDATGNEIAYNLAYTVNKATSGSDTGLLVAMTDTNSPGTSLLADFQVGGSSKFKVDNAGIASLQETWGTPTLKAAGATQGWFFSTGNWYWGTSTSNVMFQLNNTTSIGCWFKDFFGLNTTGAAGSAPDVKLARGGADTLRQIRTTNAQKFELYGTSDSDTSPTNYQRLVLSNPAGVPTISYEKGGTGVTQPITLSNSLVAATGNEIAYNLAYTVNKATSGNDTGLLVNMTDTNSPGTSLLADFQVGGSSRFKLDNAGSVSLQATWGPLILQAAGASQGWMLSGGNWYFGVSTANVTFQLNSANVGCWFKDQIGFTDGSGAGAAATLSLRRGANDTLRQIRGTNAQTFELYNTSDSNTSPTNYERLVLSTTIGTGAKIATQEGGTGADNLDIELSPAGTGHVVIDRTTLDSGFINFKATADADATSAISTLTTSGSVTHHIQIQINGTTAWIPCSTTDPS